MRKWPEMGSLASAVLLPRISIELILSQSRFTYTGTGKRKVSKVAGQSLDCYCVCSELLSASIADALLFVNMVCLLQIESNTPMKYECLQI